MVNGVTCTRLFTATFLSAKIEQKRQDTISQRINGNKICKVTMTSEPLNMTIS